MSAPLNRLCELLPPVYRMRDAERGYPLRDFVSVINEQVDVLKADIAQLYENWFIETCDDWVVPYIGDLIGYRPVHEAGDPQPQDTAEGRREHRILIPRREVANTLAFRRRKGTLAILDALARAVTGWPTKAVEFYRLLGWTQHLNHLRPGRGRITEIRDQSALDLLNGPFDSFAHNVDVRRVASHRSIGRYNIPSVGVFVWRLKTYSITAAPAYCFEQEGPQCYTFSVLGNDTQLFRKARPDPEHVASERDFPGPIRRRALEKLIQWRPRQSRASDDLYGEGKSLVITAPDWPVRGAAQPIPADKVVPADLSNWHYRAERGLVGVDPELGRIVFPPGQLPKQGVWVSYRYGFSADIGGGEYQRTLIQPSPEDVARFHPADFLDPVALVTRLQHEAEPLVKYLRTRFSASTLQLIDAYQRPNAPSGALIDALLEDLNRELSDTEFYDRQRFIGIELPPEAVNLLADHATGPLLKRLNRLLLEAAYPLLIARSYAIYRVGKGGLARLGAALTQWIKEKPRYGVVELVDSGAYTEPLNLELLPYQTLQIRAADRKRPVIRLLDYMADRPDAFTISGGVGSRFVLDGLLVTGRGMLVEGPDPSDSEASQGDLCDVTIRHSTLVPGWGLTPNCDPARPNEPSLELINSRAKLRIEHSIIGSIEVEANEVLTDPVEIIISDSILDATRLTRAAISSATQSLAFARVSLIRTTVLGEGNAHALHLAENSIFMSTVRVARRQEGCVRFCYVTPGSRTPRRFHCQPDLAMEALDNPATQSREAERVRPTFDSMRYGNPTYCRLTVDCAQEIQRGADDESEMGVFHDLFQPQRMANLRARLDEYTPAGLEVAVLFAD